MNDRSVPAPAVRTAGAGRRVLLIVCCLVLICSGAIRTGAPIAARAAQDPAAGSAAARLSLDCGGESCAAVARGALAFVDRRLNGLSANGRACADCHMVTDHFQLSPASAEARFRLLKLRQRFDPDADDPLFRPIDADDFRTNHEHARDFSNLRQNGLIRIVFPLPSKVRLIDPATNAPSSETEVDVWRMVPSVNDVKITGDDEENPWPRGPNQTGGYQLDAVSQTFRSRRWAH